jgi:hypothetical protein
LQRPCEVQLQDFLDDLSNSAKGEFELKIEISKEN